MRKNSIITHSEELTPDSERNKSSLMGSLGSMNDPIYDMPGSQERFKI